MSPTLHGPRGPLLCGRYVDATMTLRFATFRCMLWTGGFCRWNAKNDVFWLFRMWGQTFQHDETLERWWRCSSWLVSEIWSWGSEVCKPYNQSFRDIKDGDMEVGSDSASDFYPKSKLNRTCCRMTWWIQLNLLLQLDCGLQPMRCWWKRVPKSIRHVYTGFPGT